MRTLEFQGKTVACFAFVGPGDLELSPELAKQGEQSVLGKPSSHACDVKLLLAMRSWDGKWG